MKTYPSGARGSGRRPTSLKSGLNTRAALDVDDSSTHAELLGDPTGSMCTSEKSRRSTRKPSSLNRKKS